MDALLGIVTVLSLGLATAMSLIVWKLIQVERQRSEARVEALMQMAAADGANETPIDVASPTDVSTASIVEASESLLDDAPAVHGGLFAEPHRSSPWAGRLAVAAVLGTLIVGIGTLMRHTTESQAQQAGSASPPATPPVGRGGDGSLDLLTLHHVQEGGILTITGLVQNPRDGQPLAGVTATALLIGADGAIVGRGRAPLDFTRLAPGDESPFLITVPVTASVSRYRIGFRGADERVVGHVDKRSPSVPVARR